MIDAILISAAVIGFVFPTVPIMLVIGFMFIASSMFVGFIAEAGYGSYRSAIDPLITKRKR